MGLLIILTWLVAALLSFYAKSLVLLLACGAFLAFFALLLVRDFSALKARLALFLGQELGVEVVAADDSRLYSGTASTISAALEALAYKLNTLSWKLRSEELERSDAEAGQENQKADRATQLLQQFSAQFRCKASALLLLDQPGKSHAVRVLASGPLGSRGRLQRYLRLGFESYFNTGNSESLGLHDLALHKGSLASLTLLGLRYSIAVPLREVRPGLSWSGVVWLAYDSTCAPLEGELDLAKTRAHSLGRELNSIYAIEDLSRRVQSAQDREKNKDDFIAQVSHDIRSPLNNIRAILNLLRLEESQFSNADMLHVALQNCDTLSDLVSDIVDFSRHRAGKLAARPEVFDLTGMVQEVCETYKVSAKMKGVQLTLENSQPNQNVWADRRQIKRVFQNVLSNALKFTNSGSVRVQIAQDRDLHYSILVRDTGCGMRPEQLKALFVPFNSELHASGSAQDGIGLGLALSKILIELNSGFIEAHSQFGKGSLFELRLPRCQAECAAVNQAGQSVASLRESFFAAQQQLLLQKITNAQGSSVLKSQKQILVIDDDADCVDSLARMLSAEGFGVIKAYSATDAVSILNFTEVELILCDASMPDGGAKRVLQYLSGKAEAAPLVVLSGHDEQSSRAQFSALGAAEFWIKPLELEKFRAFWTKLWPRTSQVKVA